MEQGKLDPMTGLIQHRTQPFYQTITGRLQCIKIDDRLFVRDGDPNDCRPGSRSAWREEFTHQTVMVQELKRLRDETVDPDDPEHDAKCRRLACMIHCLTESRSSVYRVNPASDRMAIKISDMLEQLARDVDSEKEEREEVYNLARSTRKVM
jgi:hypothetical protein